MKISALLLAGGKGLRYSSDLPKQFIHIQGKPIVSYSLELFLATELIEEVIIVIEEKYRSLFDAYKEQKKIKFALPGIRRQDSVYNGLKEVQEDSSFVCVHDAARPLIQKKELESLLQEAFSHKAAALAVPVKSTIKRASSSKMVIETLNRDQLFEIQTPQVIHKELLHRGFEYALKNKITVTDDISLIELLNEPTKLVMGEYSNIKMTTPDDLLLITHYLAR